MFSDESRFSATSGSGNQLLWREHATGYAQNFVCVWAGIMHNVRTPLHIFESAVGTDFLFMDDNAWSHRSVEVALGKSVPQRAIPPRTVQELKIAFREELDNVPQGIIDNLVKSMKNRGKLCISVRSEHISYKDTHVCIILS
ncbi:transposable element Tc1 transposase [Trichonephila clavipes]|nr:transposable element Tc1 transposase [Trichonephila clavipes]